MSDTSSVQVTGRTPVPASAATRVDVSVAVSGGHRIAASVYAPTNGEHAAPALYFVPGGGYGRHYFDLPAPGYSQVVDATAAGLICVTLDALGVGESSIPPHEVTDAATVAKTLHEAVEHITRAMRHGQLSPDGQGLDPTCRIGVGQSMGGFITVQQQARHRTFDAIAVLGASAVATRLPLRPGHTPPPLPTDASADELAMHAVASVDWGWAFHWDDEEGRALREEDLGDGLPMRRGTVPWASKTAPGLVNSCMSPGVLTEAARAIDVPVLLCTGERDVCQPIAEELAAFPNAPDRAAAVFSSMAHMHNFARTRRQLWLRLNLFARQVDSLRAAGFGRPAA